MPRIGPVAVGGGGATRGNPLLPPGVATGGAPARRIRTNRKVLGGVRGYGSSGGSGSYVVQHLMLPGHWTLRLRRDTPQQIRRDLVPAKNPTTTAEAKSLFSHIVITPTQFDPDSLDDNLLTQALYSGVIVRAYAEFDGSVELGGHDPSWWLGDANGIGDTISITPVTKTAGTLSAWITDLLPSTISAGSVTNTGTNFTGTIQWQSRREAIDAVCRRVGAEWKIDANLSLRAGAPSALYSTTPYAFFAPRMRGYDWTEDLRGFDAVFPRIGFDASRYASVVRVAGPGAGTDIISDADSATSIALNPLTGAAATRRLLVDAPDIDRSELTGVAAKIRADWAEPVSSYTITTKRADRSLIETVGPGHYVWVYWPGVIEDTSNTVDFMGDTYPARKMRVWSFGWPMQAGMGVYYRRTDSGGTPEWVDLSPWVEWSNAAPQLTVGFRRRPPMETTERLGVRLADHQAINQRVNDTAAQRQRLTYTPSGTVDATTSTSYTDWFTIGTVNVPAWAAGVDIDVTIGAVRDLTAANNQYDLRLVLGSDNGATEAFTGLGVAVRFAARMQHRFTVTPPAGSLTLKVQAKRPSGSGQFRLNTDSNVTAVCRFFTT